nr:ATP-binding cassette domain-containing protein [Frankia gtarii]
MTALLSVDMLAAGQGGTRIVEDVSFTLEAGSVTGLIGPNGAGKTTLIDALTGFATIFAGSVHLDGAELAALPAHERQRRGLARTFQALELFDSLAVAENLAVVARPTAGSADTGRLGLAAIADRLPATLSHDERAAVALGRALIAAPKVLLLDEPAAGLDPADRRELTARIRRIAGRGVAVLLVDHDVQLVFDVCDRVLVLDGGRIVARGLPAQVRADPAVRAAYLGGSDGPEPTSPPAPTASTASAVSTALTALTASAASTASATVTSLAASSTPEGTTTDSTALAVGAELLVFEGVSSGYNEGPVLREVSLVVRAGEIVALLGANGAGKTTLIRTAAGLLPPSAGRVGMFGEWYRRPAPSTLARRGLAVVPQGRGALGRLTVRENLRLAAGRSHRGEIDRVLGWFPELGGLLDRTAGELSGGERQRLALAVALVRRPRLLLVDELSFGLAPGVAPRLLELLRGIAAETSTGVLLVEQFAALALQVADRGYVLDRGRVALSAPAAELAARPDLIEATYLGESFSPLAPPSGPGKASS